MDRRRRAAWTSRLAVGVLIVGMAVAGCGAKTAGTAKPAPATTSTTATSTTPTLASTAGLKAKLLRLPELAAIMGEPEMTPITSYTEPTSETDGFEPFACRPVWLAASATGYFAKARQGFEGDVEKSPGGKVTAQVVSVFTGRSGADQFLQSIARDWADCVDVGTLTLTGDTPQQWAVGKVEESDTRLAITTTRRGAPPRTCRHVVAIQLNAAVETLACSNGDTTAQANQIADALLAKFPG